MPISHFSTLGGTSPRGAPIKAELYLRNAYTQYSIRTYVVYMLWLSKFRFHIPSTRPAQHTTTCDDTSDINHRIQLSGDTLLIDMDTPTAMTLLMKLLTYCNIHVIRRIEQYCVCICRYEIVLFYGNYILDAVSGRSVPRKRFKLHKISWVVRFRATIYGGLVAATHRGGPEMPKPELLLGLGEKGLT